jgi:hypothetical protein
MKPIAHLPIETVFALLFGIRGVLAEPPATSPSTPPPAAAPAAPTPEPFPTKLVCKAVRADIGKFEPLRFISLTVDLKKKYVKMVQEGDGKAIEFSDGVKSPKGLKGFVTVTEETVVFGNQGQESWRIDRYTGALTSSLIATPFECQVRPTDRKF